MNILYPFRRAVRSFGANVASITPQGPLTWAEMGERVHGAAAWLGEQGLSKGDRLAVWMLNSHEYLELYYATALAGIVIVPLNTRWHENDVAFTLEDSGAAALVVDDHFATLLEKIPQPPRVIFAGSGDVPRGAVQYRHSGARPHFEEPDEDDLVGLFYTSGTTGGPKGVMLTHRNLWVNLLYSMLLLTNRRERRVWLHSAPMFHLADLGAIYSVTADGGTHAYLPTFDPEMCMKLIERHGVTETVLVPTMLNMVIHHPSFGKYDLSSLRNFLYGASPMPLPLLKEAMAKLPGTTFRQGYGMTETSPLITVLDYEDHFGEAVTSAGKPVLGVEVRVVDELDRDVPVGQSGEIISRGANTMKGYWKRPEITAEVTRGGWMHTGDIGRFDENGFLYILDRKKDMIKPGGENVYTPEVESMIAAHPAVLEVAVIGVPDEKWGEAIRAVVACRNGTRVSEEELIEWCRERMTHFKCPASVVFVDALPKGGTGKVQKGVLREKFGKATAG
ncbi:MAG TPA: long-chain fatty acid--CoA ligase [Bryobacteraceae bacterium]|nr:long-chain fatty acid--CoA ligase [Bryobacteraceae bacterium]